VSASLILKKKKGGRERERQIEIEIERAYRQPAIAIVENYLYVCRHDRFSTSSLLKKETQNRDLPIMNKNLHREVLGALPLEDWKTSH
jgi:hypothetical protein